MKKGNVINGVRTIMTAGALAYLGVMVITEVKDGMKNRRLRKSVEMINELDFDNIESNPNVVKIIERNLGEVEL